MVWRSSSAAATCPARVSCGAKVICRASAAMLSMRNFATGSIILLRREGVKVGSLHATDARFVHNIVQTAVPASLLTRTLDHPGEAHSPLFAGLVHALTPAFSCHPLSVSSNASGGRGFSVWPHPATVAIPVTRSRAKAIRVGYGILTSYRPRSIHGEETRAGRARCPVYRNGRYAGRRRGRAHRPDDGQGGRNG